MNAEGSRNGTVLVNGVDPKERNAALVKATSLVCLVLFAQAFLLLHRKHGMPWEWPFLDLLQRLPPTTLMQWAALLLGVIGVVVMSRAMSKRLVIDDDGITYSSSLPDWLKRFEPDWRVRWSEIESIAPVHTPATLPVHTALWITSGGKRRRLEVLGWRRADGRSSCDSPMPSSWRLRSATADMAERLSRSEVLIALKDRGIEFNEPAKRQLTDANDLTRTPTGKALVGMIIGGLLYAVADTMLVGEGYVRGNHWELIVHVGILAFIVAAMITLRTPMGFGEKTGVSFLVGVTLAAASYPGILRVNALLSDGPSVAVEFRQEDGARLVPVNAAEAPSMRMEQYGWYFAKQPRGRMHEIYVRKGGLGYWVYDTRKFSEKIRREEEAADE